MVMENKQSLEVDYQLLAKECHSLAYFLPEVPAQVIEIFNEAATHLVVTTFPRYSNIQVTHSRLHYYVIDDVIYYDLL